MKYFFKVLFIFITTVNLYSQTNEKRLALVIGNSNYDKGPLNNPVNDALLIAKTLDSLDFDVILDTNITNKEDFIRTIREFGNKRSDYDVAFVYYAGHGIQVGAENFLLPTKVNFETAYDVMDFGVSVQNIMRYLTGMTNQVNVLILDACRDNPFEGNWNASRSLKGDGLAKISPPTGSLIAFSTDAGMTAADGDGKNSIYCISLSENLLKEDIGLEQVFKNVRSDVLIKSNNQQSPVESSKLTGNTFYLKKNFSVYNSTTEEIFKVSNDYLNDKKYYKSIEILDEAANFEKQKGNTDNEAKYRYSIIDNYFNVFSNTKEEAHLFSLINNKGVVIDLNKDLNKIFDFKSYNLFFENLIYFCLAYNEANISVESIYNFLIYIIYVIEIPIQNNGLNLYENTQYNVDYFDRLISELTNKVNQDKYKYSVLTEFWEFKHKYMSLRKHNDFTGTKHNDLRILNKHNISKEFFRDFYTFIDQSNNTSDLSVLDLDISYFDDDNFFEEDIYNLTLKRYSSGLNYESDRMTIDLLGFIKDDKTKEKLDVYSIKTYDFYNEISNGFDLNSNIIHSGTPWIVGSLTKMVDFEVLTNGYGSRESEKLENYISKLLTYFNGFKKGLVSAKENNNQEALIKYSNFIKDSNFDILGYNGTESYEFANEMGLYPNYIYVIDSIVIPDINIHTEKLQKKQQEILYSKNPDNSAWVIETTSPIDSRYNLFTLENSEFNNVNNTRIKEDIIQLELKSKLAEIIELDVLTLISMLDVIGQNANYGFSNGWIDEMYFFEWYYYLDELLNYSKFSNQDHIIVLQAYNQLLITFSLISPNFSWDIKDITDSYIDIINLLENTDNHLVKFSIRNSIRDFINYVPSIYKKELLDNNYNEILEIELERLTKLLDS